MEIGAISLSDTFQIEVLSTRGNVSQRAVIETGNCIIGFVFNLYLVSSISEPLLSPLRGFLAKKSHGLQGTAIPGFFRVDTWKTEIYSLAFPRYFKGVSINHLKDFKSSRHLKSHNIPPFSKEFETTAVSMNSSD